MAAPHCDPPEHGSGSRSVAFADGSRVGIAQLDDEYALHVEPGTAEDVVYLDGGDVRQLALVLVDASQREEETG